MIPGSMTGCIEQATTCRACGGPVVTMNTCGTVYCLACVPKKLRHAAIRVKVIEADGKEHYEDHHYLTCVRCAAEKGRTK